MGLAAPPESFSGDLIGAAAGGGTTQNGVVFVQQAPVSGSGGEAILYNFNVAPDVEYPLSSPISGNDSLKGGLYGCTDQGGTHGEGGFYSLTPNGSHGLTEAVLYNFDDQPNDPFQVGFEGDRTLVQVNSAGTLVGTSLGGGAYGDGTFFEFDPPAVAGRAWIEKVDVSFDTGGFNGGGEPIGAPVRIGSLFYGVLTATSNGLGAVFEVTP